jgi:hypothetical protein
LCWCIWQKPGFICLDFFTPDLPYKEILYIVFKDNTPINCITVQHEKVRVRFDGPYTVSINIVHTKVDCDGSCVDLGYEKSRGWFMY